MSLELTGLCLEHSFESATALCRRCGSEFCETCVVFPFGEKKPLCKECALLIAGVKSHAPRPEMAGRIVRRRAKEFARNVTSASAPMPEPEVPAIVDTTTADPSEAAAPEPIAEPTPTPAPIPEPVPSGAGPEPAANEPAHGVAPVVDWNNPFG